MNRPAGGTNRTVTTPPPAKTPAGIEHHRAQFLHQLIQVFLVGLTLGMLRTVVPALAEQEFAVPRDSFMLLVTFVVAFGFVKGILNFFAGHWAERLGRRRVLVWGWLVALPMPWLIYFAPDWNWIVAATILLGINQGLTWSMTQTAKLDIARGDERGRAIGLNEFSGYIGVAIAGIATAYLASMMGPRTAILVFGLATVASALILALAWVKETKHLSHVAHNGSSPSVARLSTSEVFWRVSWQDRRMAAFSQAGLVEKFVDALVWVFYPLYLYQAGLSLAAVGWVVGIYGMTWGVAQLLTGGLSDRIGRRKPIIWGMWLCAAGVGLMLADTGVVWWSVSAALTGLGMALLYPNLSAAVADLAEGSWRGTAIGVYRFWRDIGYAIGALALGWVSQISGMMETGFAFVAGAMFVSGLIVWKWGAETHPLLTGKQGRR